MKWHKVNKRQLNKYKIVIVALNNGHVDCAICWADSLVDTDGYCIIDDVIAWMPFPEHPSKEDMLK